MQNLTLDGRIKEHGVDVDGAFAGDSILSDEPTELFFDKTFDLKVPIKLLMEGKGGVFIYLFIFRSLFFRHQTLDYEFKIKLLK